MHWEYNQKIVLMTESMGSPVSHYFLTKYEGVNQAWKDEHIAKYIPVVGAWAGGEVLALQIAISGTPNQFLSFLPPAISGIILDYLSPGLNSFQSLLWFVPNEAIWNDEPLVIGPKGEKYAVKDLEKVLRPEIYERYLKVKGLSSPKVSSRHLMWTLTAFME